MIRRKNPAPRRDALWERQEITWTFDCPIATHFGSLLNRKIRDVGQLRLWFRSIGATKYGAHLDPKLSSLFIADPLMTAKGH